MYNRQYVCVLAALCTCIVLANGQVEFNVTFVVCMTSGPYLAYSYGYFGPAIEMAVEELNKMFPRFNFNMVNISPPNATTCPDLDAVVANLITKYFAREPAGIKEWDDQGDNSILVLVGNGCSDSLRPTADLGREWNIPVVSSGGSANDLLNKTRFPTLMRFLPYQQKGVVDTLIEFLKRYDFKDTTLICDVRPDLGNFFKLAWEGWEKGVKSTPGMSIIKYEVNTQTDKVDFGYWLHMASLSSRVILLVAHGNTTRNIMVIAKRMGMTNGDYVFITVYPEAHPLYGYYKWQFQDDDDDDAKQAFKSLYYISTRPLEGPNYRKFNLNLKAKTMGSTGYVYEAEENVSAFTSLQYQVILFTGQLINMTIPPGTNLSTGNKGDQIIRPTQLRNSSILVKSPNIGDFYFGNSDRKEYVYIIKAMDHSHFTFDDVFTYNTLVNQLVPVPGKNITWAFRGTSPPPNRPKCGFDGDDDICQVSGGSIAGIAIGICCVLLLVIPVYIYIVRRMKKDEMTDNRWFIPYEEITFNKAKSSHSASNTFSKHSIQARSGRTSANTNSQMASINLSGSIMQSEHVGVYNGQRLWMRKRLLRHRFDLNSRQLKLILRMKRTTTANLARFLGFCPIADTEIGVLMEVCSRGSLIDIINSETIHFDLPLKISSILDICKAINYLHSSAIDHHGSLSSRNCLMDNRFVLKVAYYRLDVLPLKPPDFSKEDPADRKFLTFAPEMLRNVLNIYAASKEADVYAFAYILVHIMSEIEPFQTEMEIDMFTIKGIIDRLMANSVVAFRPKIPEKGMLTPLRMLTEKCWEEKPASRPSIEYINKYIKSVPGFEKDANFVDDLLQRLAGLAQVLEARIEVATRDTMEEKRKSDELLYQVLPMHVAHALTHGQKIDPEAFTLVTIGFTALEDFVDIAFSSTPLQLVTVLNNLYTLFDNMLQLFDVYKVETISDSYMIASGLPVRNGNNHSSEIAKFSLALMKESHSFTAHNEGRKEKKPLQLKIGFHTGSCAAGIVGNKMPRYCLFGDTINTASRMTSSGKALKIQVSHETRGHLQTYAGVYRFEFRGLMDIKGKGQMRCYWLLQEHETEPSNPGASMDALNNVAQDPKIT
ncbi:atrial natriuretic peptide receptor 1-like [Paramacrobiotus metropolitanus]|uniref:atrial natriuretic peptide receptor 1-like n=1 Tax=Paramacrobiotus metropolitanus TaxID=2943436 RepID=UPI002445C928|nr:atrial natriuretic peptide receptor 1-like [Paramacrobiotus metropolitanus]